MADENKKWSEVLSSIKERISQIESGKDYDESGVLLSTLIKNDATLLTEYYSTFPQGDNRNHKYLRIPKIGLDIDDVLADFSPTFIKKYNIPIPTSWDYSYNKAEVFDYLIDHPDEMKEFYLSLPVKTKQEDIPFEPHCYLTARSMPIEWTQEWLEKNQFPCKPVFNVSFNVSKIDIARESGIDIFVDDKYETFVEFNNAGICCFLFDAAWNQRYDVGYKRIKTLKELFSKL